MAFPLHIQGKEEKEMRLSHHKEAFLRLMRRLFYVLMHYRVNIMLNILCTITMQGKLLFMFYNAVGIGCVDTYIKGLCIRLLFR